MNQLLVEEKDKDPKAFNEVQDVMVKRKDIIRNELPVIKINGVPDVNVKRDCPYGDMAILMMRIEILKAKNHL